MMFCYIMFSAIKKWLYPPSPASFVDAKEEENEVQVKDEEVQVEVKEEEVQVEVKKEEVQVEVKEEEVEVKEEEVIESIPTKKYFPIFAP